MNHDFEHSKGNGYQCRICGLKIFTTGKPDELNIECPGPSLGKQVEHYAEAVVTHIATGSKTRTDEEVEELLTICRDCEFYDSDHSRCRVCGCRLSTASNALTNKLRMATQHCPKGRW